MSYVTKEYVRSMIGEKKTQSLTGNGTDEVFWTLAASATVFVKGALRVRGYPIPTDADVRAAGVVGPDGTPAADATTVTHADAVMLQRLTLAKLVAPLFTRKERRVQGTLAATLQGELDAFLKGTVPLVDAVPDTLQGRGGHAITEGETRDVQPGSATVPGNVMSDLEKFF